MQTDWSQDQGLTAAAQSLVKLELSSAVGGSLLPFTVGQPLAQGSVPAGSVLVGNGMPELQFVVKNRWPDGSAKFAILSGRADLGTGVWHSIGLSVAPEPTRAPAVSIEDLKATGISARVDFGAFGTAGWNAGDWDTPFRTVVTGPQMSAWTYRKPIGSDSHLVAWLEVRAYKGGRVEVMPWIENGYLNMPGPTEKVDTATFILGSSERFSQPLALLNHQRAVLAGPITLTHWFNGSDPQVTPRHDIAYVMATKLVPNYGAVTPSDSSLYSRLPTEYTPLMQGSYSPAMGSAGYHPSIGLLPEWDVAYLSTQGDPRAYRSVIINAYAAGRFGIHYRDEKTNRPLVFERYPNLVMRTGSGVTDTGGSSKRTYTPVVSGVVPPQFKTSHHPSMGYMAYLVSGWNYFMEETQLLATANFLKHGDTTRGYSQGLYLSGADAAQTRSSAWAIRTLAQAATITPDDDPLRGQFIDAAGNNIAAYYSRYVAQPNNPLGVVDNYSSGSDPVAWYIGTPWQDDFLTAATAYTKELAAYSPAIQPQLDGFLAYKFRAVTGRLGGGGQDEFAYTHGAQFTLPFAKTNTADWNNGTGPWFSSWGELARAMGIPTGIAAGAPLETGYPTAASGYWSNLMPALAYAVDMGAPGAAEGWARVTSASNFAQQLANYNNTPVWSVRPRTAPVTSTPPGGTPTLPPPPPSTVTLKSIAELPPGQWLELPNTKLRAVMPLPALGNPLSIVTGASGGTVDQSRGRLLVWGGGTSGYYGNDLYALDLPSLSVKRVVEFGTALQSGVNGVCGAALADGSPRARATYDGLTYIPHLDSFFAIAGHLSYCNDGTPLGSGGIWLRDFTNNQWVMKRSTSSLPYEYGVMAEYDKATGRVLVKGTRDFRAYSPETDTFTMLNSSASVDYRLSATIDTTRRKFVMLGMGKVQVIDLATNQMTTPTTTNVPALLDKTSPGVAYDPVADRIVAWHGGSEVWALDMNTLAWSQVAINAGPQSNTPAGGTFGRWAYVEKYNVFVLINSIDENAWVFRVATDTEATGTP